MGHLRLFQRLDPPANLRKDIMEAVFLAERSYARRQFAVFGIIFSLLLAALTVPLGIHAVSAIAQSGFARYLFLLFSDTAVVLSSFADYVGVLLESLPAIEIASVLAAAMLAVWFAAIALRDMGTVRSLRVRTVK